MNETPTTITPKPNGPLVVAGPVRIVTPDGATIPVPPRKDGPAIRRCCGAPGSLLPGAPSFDPAAAVSLVSVAEGDAGSARILTIVSKDLELGVLPARRAHAVHVVFRCEEMRQHAVVIPLSDARIRRVGDGIVCEVPAAGEQDHRVERHRAEILDAATWCCDQMKPPERHVPGPSVD